MNSLKTVLLLGLLSGLLLVGGHALGGQRGMTMGLILAVGMNFFSYFFSEKMALMSSGAVRVSETENQEIYWRIAPTVKSLCERMGLPMPRLWVIPEDAPNAFATGRNPGHSSVAVTAGLLRLMDDRELEGVIAHELGHIRNRDILVSSIAATIGAAITYAAYMAMFFGGRRDDDDAPNPLVGLLMMILAPLAAGLIQMAISRTREYGADAAAAKFTGSPRGLISALGKLESWSRRIPMDVNPSMSHMYIIKPFSGQSMARLFSTHPATEERIARLEALGAQ
ncbi:MAG: zinc metalloprotease HtpX [Candidatus Solibacter usitatus]|nr:zinc metalloprotease HtpX [Candidatus Solibacter usitatus]